MLAVVPLWALITAGSDHLILLLGTLSLAFAIPSGIWPSIVANLFPTRVRFSGIALSYNISITILSGFAPLAASATIEWTGAQAAPAIYIAACTLLTFGSTFFMARVDRAPARTLSPSAV
jgi:hypothetical protein